MITKICNKCGLLKTSDELVKRSSGSDGYRSLCKSCYNKYKNKKYKEDPNGVKESLKKYKEKNPDYIKMYREKNREKLLLQMKDYYQKNSEKLKCDMKNYHRERKKHDNIFNLKSTIRTRIYKFLLSKNIQKKTKTFEMIGCCPIELKNHLEKQFKVGMGWHNRRLWHVDHIIPLSSANTEEEIYKLCHYTNLQPLWAEDNLKKGNKLIKQLT